MANITILWRKEDSMRVKKVSIIIQWDVLSYS